MSAGPWLVFETEEDEQGIVYCVDAEDEQAAIAAFLAFNGGGDAADYYATPLTAQIANKLYDTVEELLSFRQEAPARVIPIPCPNHVRRVWYDPDQGQCPACQSDGTVTVLTMRLRGQTLDGLAREIVTWQRETFRHATPESCAAHLLHEAEELVKDPRDPMEVADVAFLLFGLCDRAGIDLVAALERKLMINRTRTWGTPDADRGVEHVREEVDAGRGRIPADGRDG